MITFAKLRAFKNIENTVLVAWMEKKISDETKEPYKLT